MLFIKIIKVYNHETLLGRGLRWAHSSWSYNAHTNPLFSKSKILKLGDLYEFEVGKLMYDAIHNTLPTPLSFLYIPN